MKPIEVWTCKKWEMLKCKSNQPCIVTVPASRAKFSKKMCPRKAGKGKWVQLPTTELTA